MDCEAGFAPVSLSEAAAEQTRSRSAIESPAASNAGRSKMVERTQAGTGLELLGVDDKPLGRRRLTISERCYQQNDEAPRSLFNPLRWRTWLL